MTTREPREPTSDEPRSQRCCSAEAAVMHWALSHIAASRRSQPETETETVPETERS